MIVTPYDAADDLIVVTATIWGINGGSRRAPVAMDTGASETIISPDVTDALGYGAHFGDRLAVIRSVIGHEHGYTMRVARFAALGFEQEDFLVLVQDLPEGYGIKGLLGLSFLRHFDIDTRPLRGELHVRPASTAA